MNDKHREVQQWLEKTYGGEQVPQYEINHRTVDILYDLMKRNEQQDRHTALVIEDYRQKEAEYVAEGERLKGVLEKVGLTPSDLSQSGTTSLRTLANVALTLDVRDTSDASLLLGLTEASQEAAKVQEMKQYEDRATSQLFNKSKAALLRYNTLVKSLQDLEEQAQFQGPELAKKAKEAGFVQSKAKEYKSRIQELEVELSRSGVDRSVFHSTLVKKSEELKELKDKLHPLKAKLDAYHKLPPDIALSKVKIEEARAELDAVEAELTKKLDLMSM